jgi:hypothetical protein
MPTMFLPALALVTAPTVTAPTVTEPIVPAPIQAPDLAAAWSEDALHFVAEVERLHPNPWFGCAREDFEREVDVFFTRLEDASENQALAGFMQLVAGLSRAGRDGHTTVWPMTARYLPIQLYGFSDGWHVVAAGAGHAELVGARVLTLGGATEEDFGARTARLLTQDNAWNVRQKLALALTCVELLEGVGLCQADGRVALRIERGGKQEELVLASEAQSPHTIFMRPALPARGEALWLQGREQAWRLHVLEEQRALYVQFNEVASAAGDGQTLAAFAAELVRTFEELELAKVVVDVRSNGGGDNTTFGPLIAALQTPAIDRPGVLFGLIGRATFSAAGNFVTVLERDTKAILVGEPTGGAPNQYGDARDVPLPNHPGVLVRVSTRYHQFSRPDDARLTHEPHLAVPLRAQDYFAGRDPVLEAALAYQPPR